MPQIESQKKRVLTNRKSYEANKVTKSSVKTSIRNFYKAVDEGNKEEAAVLLNQINKLLDQSITSNIHHKNYAARQKSRVSRAYNNL